MHYRFWGLLDSCLAAVEGESEARSDALKDDIEAFTKLLVALQGYPTGQQMIVFGILILIIAGVFGGVQCFD